MRVVYGKSHRPIVQASRISDTVGPLTVTSHPAHPRALRYLQYILHRTRLRPSVTFTTLVLLHRFKTGFPAARCSSGYRLFLSAKPCATTRTPTSPGPLSARRCLPSASAIRWSARCVCTWIGRSTFPGRLAEV